MNGQLSPSDGTLAEAPTTGLKPITWAEFGREMGIILIVGAAVWALFAYVIYPPLGWPKLAPVPARTVVLVGLVWWLMRKRGESFRDIGLCRPKKIWLAALLGILFLASNLFIVSQAVQALREALGVAPGDQSILAGIHGDLALYIMWLVIAWVAAGFGEEIFIRGYLMNRLATLFGGEKLGWTLAIIGQGVIFGMLHAYAGFGGVMVIGLSAMVTGVYYLIAGRNIWPLIFVHGAWDTLGITLYYLKGVPEL
ncbi:MAG: type II CAAX endopeptidase family protein [Sphingomonadales bacterium]